MRAAAAAIAATALAMLPSLSLPVSAASSGAGAGRIAARAPAAAAARTVKPGARVRVPLPRRAPAGSPAWTALGPTPAQDLDGPSTPESNSSGRVTSLAPDPTNAAVVYVGTASGGLCQLFTSSAPITQDTVGSATAVAVTQVPGASGAKETITVPASKNKGYFAIRAVDSAGNIGPLEYTAGPPTNVPEFGLGPAGALGLASLAIVALVVPRRRRRAAR
jgi:hypothetical protein